jgi:NAD(P)-dependent dehydrogenase (short-subunit alcohol dehydrogenase family)
MTRLKGKVALITGAARGQGRSHALRLAEEGADIIAIDVCRQIDTVPYPLADPDDLVTTVDLVKSRGRRVFAARVDVRDLAGMSPPSRPVYRNWDIWTSWCQCRTSTTPPAVGADGGTVPGQIDVNLTGVWKTIKATVRLCCVKTAAAQSS